jgi:L-malate glycosyltransferase
VRTDSFQGRILQSKRLPRLFKFVVLVAVNWFFHGFLYMDATEKAFYVLLDGLMFFPVLVSFRLLNFTIIASAVTALIIAHTIHWLIDGHLYVLLKNFGICRTRLNKFAEYVEGLRQRASAEKSILLVAAFGSLSRDQFLETSDLDIRIVRKMGILNGFRACCFAFMERTRALATKIPLDVYTLDGYGSLSKLSPDEPPIILVSEKELLK